MKIVITEEQAKRLKFINESDDIIGRFEQLCHATIQDVNKIFLKVSNISVIEILNRHVDPSEIYKQLDQIENKILNADKQAYAYIETQPENDLDLRIDRAYSAVTDKINSLQLIVMELERLHGLEKEHNLNKSFADAKPLEISSNQS